MTYVTRSGNEFSYQDERWYMDFFNFYRFLIENYSAASIEEYFDAARKKGIKGFRLWFFDAGKPPTNTAGNLRYLSGNTLIWRESQWVQADLIADIAAKYGLKLYPCFADNTTNYNTKQTYVTWANAVYGSGLSTDSPYTGFFDSADCRTIFKELLFKFANRVNTINGKIFKEDPVWNFVDLGNELRYDVFDDEGGTQNTIDSTNIVKFLDWYDEMSTYFKGIAPNILISCSSASHTWQWAEGDRVSNGSGYGRDYGKEADLTNVDFIDVHHYPTQGQTELHKFGQRLGYSNAISKAGHDAQLADYVSVVKAKGKGIVMGEFGLDKDSIDSNLYYPLNPRWRGYKAIYDTWYAAGGDGIIPWSAANHDSGSTDVNIKGYSGTNTNNNSDDRPLMRVIVEKMFSGTRKPISAE